jgi:molecular chaperone GrpE
MSDDPVQDEPEAAPLDVAVEVEPPAADDASEPAEPAEPVDQVAQLEAALARSEAEKRDNWDKFLRAAADLENHRRRSKRDLDDARAEARTRVLKEMLPVVDNLERGLHHAQESMDKGDPAAIVEGIRLVLRQFATAFERCDVTPVEADGQPFDPNVHEAISQVESPEHAPGTIVQVLQRGYKLGDRLLRPSLVVVAKASPASGDGESQG